MRILMLCKACVVGAYQRKLEEIAAYPDVDLRVLVPPRWRDPARGMLELERAHASNYDLRATPIRFNGRFHLHYYPDFGRQVKLAQPDIVHIDEEPYNLATWQALWHARRNGAHTIFFSWQNINRRYPLPIRLGEQWVLRSADYAIMGTASAAEVWRAKGYRGPLAVIPQFGVDPDIFSPPVHRRTSTPRVGFVGRLVEEKGGIVLLDALAQLKGPWQLDVVGEGPQRPLLEARAKRLGLAERVSFAALPSGRMPEFYRSIDVLAVPSLTRPNWMEQFGRVIVEAMACGVAVIASSSGAIPDVVGDAGIIVPEGNSAALAAELEALLGDDALRADLGRRGRARMLAHYTQASIAGATVDVYRRMMQP